MRNLQPVHFEDDIRGIECAFPQKKYPMEKWFDKKFFTSIP